MQHLRYIFRGNFMKHFKQILILTFIIITSPAWAGITWFTTVDQAEKYCPALTGLTYQGITQYQGAILGINPSGRNFISYDSNNKTVLVMRPANISIDQPSGPVANADFRNAGFGYGFINTDNNDINCFYWYPGYTGVHVALVMITG
jgi:hypothetical protein